jgi:hypothetical protein
MLINIRSSGYILAWCMVMSKRIDVCDKSGSKEKDKSIPGLSNLVNPLLNPLLLL